MENVDTERLREMTTPELVRHALDEAKLLARAEVLHAKEEMKEELGHAKLTAALGGAAVALVLSALSVLFVLIGIALPVSEPVGLIIVFAFLVLVAGGCAFIGYRALPRKPMKKTQGRLKSDLALAREQLQ